jgi:hypothetical protein
MLATVRHASALALVGAVLVGGASPAFATDRVNDKPLPVDFTIAITVPFVPGVPASLLNGTAVDLKSTPLADAAQTRPIEMAIPRGGSSTGTSLRRSMYVSFAGLQLLDAMSTRKALARGATEANPAMAGIVKNSTAFMAIKAGTAVSTMFLAERVAKNHPRRAMILMAVLNAGYAAVVAHNYRVANAR